MTCSGSASSCLNCTTTPKRVSTTNCSCISHYYETGSACAVCDYKCGNCSTAATTCSSCSDTTRTLSGSACPCNNGYYWENGVAVCVGNLDEKILIY